jgi:hypothetical protein
MLNGVGTLPTRRGQVQPFVLSQLDELNEKGIVPLLVDEFARKGEIDERRFTPEIKAAMVDHLVERGFKFTDPTLYDGDEPDKFKNGAYDEHFVNAYEYASQAVSGRADPIDTVRRGGRSVPWDFTVRTFDFLEELGVVADNIRAAGAVDYVYELGENLKVMPMLDVVLLEWWRGRIEDPTPGLDDLLYNTWIKKKDRSTREEALMLYRRVLNKGAGEVIEGMVVNEHFPLLWGNFMSEVAEYIDKEESNDGTVSRNGIYQAMRDLQYNLTQHCTGAAHRQVWELYAQLEDAFRVLEHPEIIAYYGGSPRKGLWGLIGRIAREAFEMSLPIGPRLRMAVDGNKLFQAIAGYDGTPMREDDFRTMIIEPGESYILNAAASGGEPEMPEDEAADEESDGFNDEFGDDF